MATTADFKNGLVLKVDGKLQQIVEFQHVKPGKGPAFVRTKLKDVVSGKTIDKTWNAGVKENTSVQVSFHEGEPLFAELPVSVELKIEHTDPGLQGDRSTGGSKPATLETGAEIQVPLFLETGNVVKVDTRTGEYLSRVNN